MTMNKFAPFFLVILLFIAACEDQGDPVTTNVPVPTLVTVSPDSGKAADTITVVGTNFGSTRGSSVVTFGSTDASVYSLWSATQIKVLVPAGGSSGTSTVSVTVGGKKSTAKAFKIIAAAAAVSFNTDIKPMFTSYGCAGCHGSSGGLSVATVSSLLTGGNHGAAIVPGNADNSNIVKKLRTATLPFGNKMPANGGNVSDSDLQKIKDWINQGALNN
jgi:mono/diheme cytochrome c family protein